MGFQLIRTQEVPCDKAGRLAHAVSTREAFAFCRRLGTYSAYADGRLWEGTRALCSKAVDNIPSAVVASFVSRFSANAPTSCNGTFGWLWMSRRRHRPSRLPRL